MEIKEVKSQEDLSELLDSLPEKDKKALLKTMKLSLTSQSLVQIKDWVISYESGNAVDEVVTNVTAHVLNNTYHNIQAAMKGKKGISGVDGMSIVVATLRDIANTIERANPRESATYN